jgi:hypothetical protein
MRSLLELEVCRKFSAFLSQLFQRSSWRRMTRPARFGGVVVEERAESENNQDNYDLDAAKSDMAWEGGCHFED